MLRSRLGFACSVLFIATTAIAAPPSAEFAPTRYTVVKDDRGVWWFQSPSGDRFYSLGINNVTSEPYSPRPGTQYYDPVPGEFKGDLSAWASSIAKLLTSHGFNTAGAWSSSSIPTSKQLHTTPVLYVVANEHERCLTPLRADFEDFVRTTTRAAIAKLPTNREHIIGVFLDNEMAWFGKSGWDEIPTYTLLEQAFSLPRSDERRAAAIKFLQSRHGTIESLAKAYVRPIDSWDNIDVPYLSACIAPATMADRDAFTAMLGERFFETTTRIVRAELPGTLILGTRFPGNAPESVIRSCGKYCEVVSVNEYRFEPTIDERNLARFYVLGGRPLMHTEFSWRAKQNASGNPNSRGAGAIVETQADRAAAYSSFVGEMATVPYVIASHWFEFADQSPQGRFDGENSNYGIVDIRNRPYTELLEAMKATNARVPELHAATKRTTPTSLPPRREVTYTPGQHPGRAPTLDLLGEWVAEPELWGAPDARLQWLRGEKPSELILTFDTGSQYGAGINIFGPVASKLDHGPRFATDLDGYATIVLDATAPKGLQINIVVAEAGAAASSSTKFDTSAGDDGEGYVSLPLVGEGERHTYKLPIAGLFKQKFFGNQAGQNRIDMQAVRVVGIQASGTPQTGRIVVHGFRLER